jgi:hypothetical protein
MERLRPGLQGPVKRWWDEKHRERQLWGVRRSSVRFGLNPLHIEGVSCSVEMVLSFGEEDEMSRSGSEMLFWRSVIE